ncbi:3-phosphoinositide-dependent protein kinase 1-like [Bolinopsis microptera]|uniref:3-phosphoinositide-dependent protein kinase 1-like n=1 Tax=Bolinopsis microptera TaxID=2820187 RepID=UPI00307A424D
MANIFNEPYCAIYNKVPHKEVKPGKKQVADFHYVKTIGEGSFAAVLKVSEKGSDREFAMKILEKRQIQKENMTARVMRERDIICSLDHTFIIRLYCTFQSETHLFFCLTLAENGCILDYLLKYGSFSLPVSMFYIAELVHVIDYMHSKNVLHRDIKPENILLDSRMHILLTDFGTAGTVTAENQRRKSFVGTAQYVAPELLGEGEKYTCKESDLWAVGCVLYQFISGKFPFRGSNDWAIFQIVKKCEYKFEEGFPELEKDFIKKLLILDPTQRLGSQQTGGIGELKKHDLFTNVDWEGLSESTPPKIGPYLPLSDSENGSLTDESVEIEEFDKLSITAPKKLIDNRQSLLSQQAQSHPDINKHLNGNELIVKDGIINKRRGLSRKKRHLILTDYPSLYYIDPASKILKGEIPWEGGLEVRQKGKKHFQVHVPNRVYYLESASADASEWCKSIQDVKTMVQERPKT